MLLYFVVVNAVVCYLDSFRPEAEDSQLNPSSGLVISRRKLLCSKDTLPSWGQPAYPDCWMEGQKGPDPLPLFGITLKGHSSPGTPSKISQGLCYICPFLRPHLSWVLLPSTLPTQAVHKSQTLFPGGPNL